MPQNRKVIFDVSYSTFLKIILITAVFVFLYLVWDILLLIFLAIVIASAIDPWVDWLHRKRIPRWLSVLAIFAVLIGILVLTFAILVPPLVEQTQQLLSVTPEYLDAAEEYIENFTGSSASIQTSKSDSLVESLSDGAGNLAGGLYATVANVFGGVISFVIVFVLAFYFTVHENAFRKFIRSVAPTKHRPYVDSLIERIQRQMGKWLRGQLILGLAVATLVYIGLSILGVKYALVLAIFAGVVELIPYIGPVIGAIPAVLIALVQSPILALIVVGLYIIVQQLENHILVPKIMQKFVGLNPLIIILCILFGAKIAGVLGAIIAVPVATAINVFIGDILEDDDKREDLAKQAAKEVKAREEDKK